MQIKVEVVEGGRLPEYKTEGSVGADCYARVERKKTAINPLGKAVIPLGFRVEIPRGYEIQVRPRSGLASKGIFGILGTIDDDYRGEVCAIIFNGSNDIFVVNDGDRIAQIVLAPVERCEWTEGKLSDTERGDNGFGSTGVAVDRFYEPFRCADIEEAEQYLGRDVDLFMDGGVFVGKLVQVREIHTVVGKALRFWFRNDSKEIEMDAFRAFQLGVVDGHRFGKLIC